MSSDFRTAYGRRMLSPMREPEDDRDLMLRYAGGDPAAFEQLYNRNKGSLYRFLLRQSGNNANADELFQETWLKVINARERYRPSAKFSTWLFQIARNCFLDSLRKHGRNALSDPVPTSPDELATPGSGPERQAQSAEAGQRILDALHELPQEQREAFLLREEGGMTLEEIGQVTGVGRETVKSRLRYALAKLRRTLETPDDN